MSGSETRQRILALDLIPCWTRFPSSLLPYVCYYVLGWSDRMDEQRLTLCFVTYFSYPFSFGVWSFFALNGKQLLLCIYDPQHQGQRGLLTIIQEGIPDGCLQANGGKGVANRETYTGNAIKCIYLTKRNVQHINMHCTSPAVQAQAREGESIDRDRSYSADKDRPSGRQA